MPTGKYERTKETGGLRGKVRVDVGPFKPFFPAEGRVSAAPAAEGGPHDRVRGWGAAGVGAATALDGKGRDDRVFPGAVVQLARGLPVG